MLRGSLSVQLRRTHAYNPANLVQVHQRGLRKGNTPKKPKITVRISPEGQLIVPPKIVGWHPDEVEVFRKWVIQRGLLLKGSLGSGISDRFKEELNNEVKDYFKTKWGIRMSSIRERAKKKRRLKRKARRDRLLHDKVEQWNLLEDAKENKILRDRARFHRQDIKQPFSLKEFLAEHRDKKRAPVVIGDEETFRKQIEEKLQKNLIYAPKVLRRKHRNPLNYDRVVHREVVAPWLLEVQRRALVAEMVEKREDALALVKWREHLAMTRAKNLAIRQKLWLERQKHWNKTLGGWHEQSNALRAMKEHYMLMRQEVMKHARKEFLLALSEESFRWVESPNECRFTRFRFAMGVEFPRNKSAYI